MKKGILGILIIMESFFLLLSMFVAIFYGEDGWLTFLLTSLGTIALGAFCIFLSRRGEPGRMRRADNFLIVALSWIVFSFVGMFPYLSLTDMNVSSAFFETMSGFTTTGATCITDIDSLPKSLLFWRAITQWIGGLGIVVFSFALIPVYEMKNSNLYSAEVTGLGLDKLRPKIGSTARRVLLIYLVLTGACALAYWLGPMNLYDAVCHSFTTIATGGFSTHSESIAFFHSSYIEYVACLFMIISSINFSLYYYMSIRRSRVLFTNEEVRVFLAYIGVAVLGFILLFYFAPVPEEASETLPKGFEETFRTSLFNVVAIMTSSGYQATCFDYVAWGQAFIIPTVLLMAVGGCSGSTSGGIKVSRIAIAVKNLIADLKRQLHPQAVIPVKMSKRSLEQTTVMRVMAFIMMYIITVLVATLLLTCLGMDFTSSFVSCVSAMSNIGPAYGMTGPATTFAAIPDIAKWILSGMMLVGRLEIFTVLLLFTKEYKVTK